MPSYERYMNLRALAMLAEYEQSLALEEDAMRQAASTAERGLEGMAAADGANAP